MKRPKLECFVKSNTSADPDMMPKVSLLKESIINQLQQVYKMALADASYPSALKSIELTMKMLPLLESTPSSTPSITDLDTSALKKLIEELE